MQLDLGVLVLAGGALFALLVALTFLVRRRRRAARGLRAFEESAARGALPRSLHPVIDPEVCIGSLSCLKACPEGDILGVVQGAARLVHGDHCVGHGRCAAECPVGAIRLVFGTSERGVDLPEVSGEFESSRPGVYVVGELGGMGLVANAMRQGLECLAYLAERFAPRQGKPAGATTSGKAPPTAPTGERVDVAVVGAGPAGLAAALGARRAGLSYRLLEQGALGGAVAHYPRHKVVMTETVELPFHGRFGKRRMSKPELLAGFRAVVERGGLEVEEGVRVTGLEGEDGAFELLTAEGRRIATRKVVLAVGRRGTPRMLGVAGEELAKVTYGLDDAEQYRGERVLVVGGGDSALEAAAALAEASAEVTLSYRGEALARCRSENRERALALAAGGRLSLLLGSTVREVMERQVVLDHRGAERRLPNDYVIASLGGDLPLALLDRLGVAMRRYFGEAQGEARAGLAGGKERYLAAAQERQRAARRRGVRLALSLAFLGCALVAFLAWQGRDYYLLGEAARRRSPLHRSLRPAGPWGHGVGIAATLVMLSNFLYAARKRFRFATSWGNIRTWLQAHVFFGFLAPSVIAFHAAFQSRNLLATGTAGALLVVVATGIVGRYVYGLVPRTGARAEELADLQAELLRLRDEVEPLMARARDPGRVRRIFLSAAAPAKGGSLLLALARRPFQSVATRVRLRSVRSLFPSREGYQALRAAYLRAERLRVQIGFYRSLKKLLGGWRLFHASLALFLVLVMAAHIGVSLYLGYGLLTFTR